MAKQKDVTPFRALEVLKEPVKRDNTMRALTKVYRRESKNTNTDTWFIQRVLLIYKPEFEEESDT